MASINYDSKFLKMVNLVYEDLAPVTSPGTATGAVTPPPAGSTAASSLSSVNQPLKAAILQRDKAGGAVKQAELKALQDQANKLKNSK